MSRVDDFNSRQDLWKLANERVFASHPPSFWHTATAKLVPIVLTFLVPVPIFIQLSILKAALISYLGVGAFAVIFWGIAGFMVWKEFVGERTIFVTNYRVVLVTTRSKAVETFSIPYLAMTDVEMTPGSGNAGSVVVRLYRGELTNQRFEIKLIGLADAETVHQYIKRQMVSVTINPEPQHFVDFESLSPVMSTGFTASNTALLGRYWFGNPHDLQMLWCHQWSIGTFLRNALVIPVSYLLVFAGLVGFLAAMVNSRGQPAPTEAPIAGAPATEAPEEEQERMAPFFLVVGLMALVLPVMSLFMLYITKLLGRRGFVITKRNLLTLQYGGFTKNVCAGDLSTTNILTLFPLTVTLKYDTLSGFVAPSVLSTLWMGEIPNAKFAEELIWELLVHHTHHEQRVTV